MLKQRETDIVKLRSTIETKREPGAGQYWPAEACSHHLLTLTPSFHSLCHLYLLPLIYRLTLSVICLSLSLFHLLLSDTRQQ